MNPDLLNSRSTRGRHNVVSLLLCLAFLFALAPASAADLALAKTATPDPVTAGGLVTYSIGVTNNGPDDAANVVVTDILPAGVRFVSSTHPCNRLSTGEYICPLGQLPPGAVKKFDILVQVDTGTLGLVENKASVSADTDDPNPDNDADSAIVEVIPPQVPASADLAVTKIASTATITPGDTFDYTLTVVNLGPDVADNVRLFDPLPPGLSLLNSSGNCTGDTLISCQLGVVPVGQKVEVVLEVQSDFTVSDKIDNTASVTSESVPDPNPANNLGSVSVSVIDIPPPALTLLPSSTVLPSALVGQPYRVVFSGSGGEPPLTLVGNNAPPGLSFVLQTGNQLELRGVPAQAGNYIVSVTLLDSASPRASIVRNYTLAVGMELDLRPLEMPLTQVGDDFIVTFRTVNGVPPENFTSSDPLPPGLALNGSSLTGIPDTVGEFDFTIQVIDSAGNQGLRNYTLNVLPAGLLILTETLPDAVVNSPYGAQVQAIGGVPPYRWRADSAMPAGLTFSDSGFVNGRPRIAGSFVISVTVQDQAGSEASADLSLTVNPAAMTIPLPEILPDGNLGEAYRVPIPVEGGQPPYRARIIRGRLPPGIRLSSDAAFASLLSADADSSPTTDLGKPKRQGNRFVISGTPRKPGVYRFVIFLRDSSMPPLRSRSVHEIRVLGCDQDPRWLQRPIKPGHCKPKP